MRFACLLVVVTISGCLDDLPDDPTPPAARVVTAWDPLLCRDPRQRVVVELEDDDGFAISSSAACVIGSLTLDARKWGFSDRFNSNNSKACSNKPRKNSGYSGKFYLVWNTKFWFNHISALTSA